MNEARMAEAQARLDAATPGPWDTEQDGPHVAHVMAGEGDIRGHVACDARTADAIFIAAARTDLRDALAALRRVREREQQYTSLIPEHRCESALHGVGHVANEVAKILRSAIDGEASTHVCLDGCLDYPLGAALDGEAS